MLTIAVGIILGFFGIAAIVLVIYFFRTVPIVKGIGEGLRGFKEGMRNLNSSDKKPR